MTLYRWFLRFSANYSSRTSTATSYHSFNHLFYIGEIGIVGYSVIKIEIVDILFTITKTIQERRCLKYKPENGYSGKKLQDILLIMEETNSYIINSDFEDDPTPQRRQI